MTFRGLIGACVLLTAPAAAFGQKPTAAKQPVAADSAAAQPAEKQPAARIVVFRDSLVLIHCDTPPLFREGDIRTFREWVNEQVRNVRIVIGCPPFPPRVVVSFVIGTTGRLTGIRVLQSPDSKLSALKAPRTGSRESCTDERSPWKSQFPWTSARPIKKGPDASGPFQFCIARYFRCGFRRPHSPTGGRMPIAITSSRSLQRCS